ncbi:MAG TPA: hypothetical protein DCW29_10395 [Janthinobacterium sp.]|nr:hypothetical protein [Janthinobacterium sp.]
MRSPIFLMFFAIGTLPIDSFAQQQLPAVTQLSVHARANVPDLVCEKRPPVVRRAAPPNTDPMEIPSDDLLVDTTPTAPANDELARPASAPPRLGSLSSPEGFRIAVWGDSHLAANFFTEELAKQLKVSADAAPNVLIPATMGKAGVRLPLRQSCVSSSWKYEPGYLGGERAVAPGPGLVNLYSEQAGATLAWDIRKDAQAPGYERVRILYQQTEAPMVVAISVDGDTEQEVTLHEKAGPAILELVAERPMTQVRLRLIDARFRFHGLELLSAQAKPAQPQALSMDVFGYPGATVASWKYANLNYLGAWFAQRQYQLVILEFGTNEGNAKPFDLAAYRQTLTESVRNMKTIFPAAACVLIAPGDRGVLIRRSANVHKKNRTRMRAMLDMLKWRNKKKSIDLFEYSKIHAAIGRVQAEVAADAGCSAWSMQDAMGGRGRAYEWAQASPALMSRDLTHFTVAGYRRLAQQFAKDMGWIEAPPP